MYRLRQSSSAAFRQGATFLVMCALFWRLTGTAAGQETALHPSEFQRDQRSAVQAPMPQKTQVMDNGVRRASLNQPVDETPPARLSSSAQGGASTSLPKGLGTLAPDSPIQQPSPQTLGQQNIAAKESREFNPAPAAHAPLPLPRNHLASPALAQGDNGESPTTDGLMPGGIDSLLTVAGSLGIVMGLFMVTMWCLRRGMPKAVRPLPAEVVEVLGRAPLAGKQQMHLIRFGSKLVLAAVSPTGIDAVSEITDPVEADRLLGYCEQSRSSSATASFRGILDRLDARSIRNSDEPSRRSHRERSSQLGRENARLEDEYA